jgi:hypothetical protein
MSGIRGKEVAGKKVHILTAFMTRCYLNPKEVFDMGIVRTGCSPYKKPPEAGCPKTRIKATLETKYLAVWQTIYAQQ